MWENFVLNCSAELNLKIWIMRLYLWKIINFKEVSSLCHMAMLCYLKWAWTKIMNENEKVKYEIARELGLIEKVMKDGWKSLSPKETGRIGGLVNKRKRAQIQESQQI